MEACKLPTLRLSRRSRRVEPHISYVTVDIGSKSHSLNGGDSTRGLLRKMRASRSRRSILHSRFLPAFVLEATLSDVPVLKFDFAHTRCSRPLRPEPNRFAPCWRRPHRALHLALCAWASAA